MSELSEKNICHGLFPSVVNHKGLIYCRFCQWKGRLFCMLHAVAAHLGECNQSQQCFDLIYVIKELISQWFNYLGQWVAEYWGNSSLIIPLHNRRIRFYRTAFMMFLYQKFTWGGITTSPVFSLNNIKSFCEIPSINPKIFALVTMFY